MSKMLIKKKKSKNDRVLLGNFSNLLSYQCCVDLRRLEVLVDLLQIGKPSVVTMGRVHRQEPPERKPLLAPILKHVP